MTDERYNGQFYAKGNDMVVADLEAEGSLVPRRTSPTPTPTAGAASTPSSTGPPSSGSAPWTPSRTRR